ncbi:hypothetical protein ZOSMA_8G01250 [Zostera marina]|uniref:Uncharacterized protein n=1 Tax=Zostera marina TaxID=29655 RepID=A0A0K9NJN4_ZOSMR|nr:hypothetical protein ZOSMA_8G01250 [Zostera marina]
MAGTKGRDRNILETFNWTLHMWQVIICIRLHSRGGMFIKSSLQCCKHLTPDKIMPALESLLTADVSNIVRLAIVLLAEKKLGQVSTWASYVNSLPLCEDMHNTIIWSKDELEMVQPSSVYQETFDQKVCIEKEFYVIKHSDLVHGEPLRGCL